jgi:hypothetical protein
MITIKERNGYDFVLDLHTSKREGRIYSNTINELSKRSIQIPDKAYSLFRALFSGYRDGIFSATEFNKRLDLTGRSITLKEEVSSFFLDMYDLMNNMMHS